MSNNTRSSVCEYTRPGACIRVYTPSVHCLRKETNVQVAFQVLYSYTSVSDVPNARANQAHIKIYPESYSDAGRNVHTKQTIAENNLPYYLLDQVITWV